MALRGAGADRAGASELLGAAGIGHGALRERTRLLPRRGEVVLEPGGLRLADRGVLLELAFEEEPGIEARCPHGRSESWTRKQAGVRAHGTLALDGGSPRPVEALAVIDDSAGWHQRVTEWRWSAGVGKAPDGTPLAWNLVSGINDPERASERAVWVGGVPHEVGPVEFDPELRFDPRARRLGAALHGGGRARAAREPAARQLGVPRAVRDLLGRPAWGRRAGERARGDGAPPRALVAQPPGAITPATSARSAAGRAPRAAASSASRRSARAAARCPRR